MAHGIRSSIAALSLGLVSSLLAVGVAAEQNAVTRNLGIQRYVEIPSDTTEPAQATQQSERQPPTSDDHRLSTGRQLPNVRSQIIIHTKLVEVSRGKLRDLGVDWSDAINGSQIQGVEAHFGLFSHHPTATGELLNALCQNGLARVLAEPTLVTLDGRPASFATEGKTPKTRKSQTESEKPQTTGTRLDVVPRTVSKNTVCIDLRLEWSGLDAKTKKATKDDPRRIRRHVVDTAIEAEFGHSVVVGSSADPPDETVVYLVVRPDLVSPRAPVQGRMTQQPPAGASTTRPSPLRR